MSNFKVTTEVTAQRVEDLLCCGMESGSYGSFKVIGYEPEELAEQCTYPHIEMPFKAGTVLMRDRWGDSKEVYRLDHEALQRGLDVLAEKCPHQMGNFMQENEDVITGDAFLQCALLGDIIYG